MPAARLDPPAVPAYGDDGPCDCTDLTHWQDRPEFHGARAEQILTHWSARFAGPICTDCAAHHEQARFVEPLPPQP